MEIAGFLLNPDLGFPNSQPPPNLRRSNTDRGTRSAKCTMGGAYTIEGKSSVWGKPLTAIRLRSGRRGRKRCLRCISARSVSERSTFRRTQVHKGTLSLSRGGLPDGQKRTGKTPFRISSGKIGSAHPYSHPPRRSGRSPAEPDPPDEQQPVYLDYRTRKKGRAIQNLASRTEKVLPM